MHIYKYEIYSFIFLLVELVGYLWHRFINHLGFLGDKIRVTHYCHHEEIYPHNDMISEEYKTSHDTWPWFIPLFILDIYHHILYTQIIN